MKKFLCTLLVALFCITSIPLNGFTIAKAANETTYITKSDLESGYIYFGSYPQSEVTNSATISALNAKAPDWNNWTSYGYYAGNYHVDSQYNSKYSGYGTMKQVDWMRYTDVVYNGVKYRGVKFTNYRPDFTYSATPTVGNQKINGYKTGTIYWFRFEPLKWRVLDANTGFIMCDKVIDSQAYSNTIYQEVEYIVHYQKFTYYNDSARTHYASDYETSSIREWLNNDFYNTAFTSEEKSSITTTSLNNDGYYTSIGKTGREELDSAQTNDKIFLLSYNEVLNSDYGFSNESIDYDDIRMAHSSEYARCQGVEAWFDDIDDYLFADYNDSYSSWSLRSPGSSDYVSCDVDFNGWVGKFNYVYDCDVGVRPALKLDLNALQISSITLSSASATYNGKEKTPSITVVDASNNELVNGTDFTYSYYLQGKNVNAMVNPGTYTIEVTFMGNYSGTKELTFTIRPGKTSSITAVPTAKGTTKITWNTVKGATGYRIYMHNGKTWKFLKTVTNRTYTITKDYNGKALKMGTQYKICVKAITKEADGNIIAASSYTSKSFKQIPATVTLKASSSNGKVNLSWTNIAGETGYQIWYSTSKNGTYTKLSTTKADVVKFSKALTKGKTYYFKVRAYTKVSSNYIYSSFSSVVSCKIK